MTLRVREIRPFGSVAKYSNLDLGRETGTGRGDVTAAFHREVDGKYECFAFVPDTLHNRVMLLQKGSIELAVQAFDAGIYVWRRLKSDELDVHLAPAKDMDAPEPQSNMEVGTSAAAVATEAVIKDLEDFLRLTRREQLNAVKDTNFPLDKLAEIMECKDVRLSEQAREAAIKKAEKLTGDG